MSIVQPAALGRYVPDRMLLVNQQAELSTEPDGLFFSWDTVRSHRLKLVEKPGQGFMELDGTPDMVLEVVRKNSVRKDTVLLPNLYWLSKIPEYWLVDVRQDKQSSDILQWTTEGYVPTVPVEGWTLSKVFGKRFRLQQQTDPLGHPQYVVAIQE